MPTNSRSLLFSLISTNRFSLNSLFIITSFAFSLLSVISISPLPTSLSRLMWWKSYFSESINVNPAGENLAFLFFGFTSETPIMCGSIFFALVSSSVFLFVSWSALVYRHVSLFKIVRLSDLVFILLMLFTLAWDFVLCFFALGLLQVFNLTLLGFSLPSLPRAGPWLGIGSFPGSAPEEL